MGKSIENGIGRILVAVALISILAVAPTAGATFTEDFNIIDSNVWEEFMSGNVNGKMLSAENGKLKIGFSAHDFHPNIGYAGLKTKNKINIIPGTIEFTTELDNTNNPGSQFPEHAPVVVLSTEADTFPGVSNSGQTASFQNALVFYKELSGNRGIVDTIIYKKDGTGAILYSTGQMPHGTNPETKWKIDFQSSNDIKIYRDNNLIYENSSFNFPANEVYLYAYMYSSSGQWRYVLFDYILVRDTIPPTTDISLSGTVGNNGWYTSDVQVTLIATDDEGGSGVQRTEYSFNGTNWNQYTGQFTITNEGTTAVYYRSTDNAGNVESTKTQTIKIDKTPPTITNGATVEEAHLLIGGNIGNVYLAETPPEYAYLIGTGDEWGEIYVTFNYEDSTSETLSVSIPWDWSSPPGDWTGTYAYRKYVGINPVRCSRCTMFEAGFINPNPARKVISIRVSDDWVSWYPWSDVFALTVKSPDALKPATWYSDNSGYYFLEKDDTQYFNGIAPGGNNFPEYSIYNGIKFYTHGQNDWTSYGRMDLSYEKTVTMPTTTIALSGALGNNGWYTSDVQVTLTATDNEGGSGVQKTEYSFDGTDWNLYTVPFTITNEGMNTVYYRSIDNAGNVEPIQNQTIKIDKTSPSIDGAPTTSPNANGWYNTDVVVQFTASDAISGIDTVTPYTTISTEGASQSVTGTAVDKAGNSASTTVSGINIDKTPPEVTINIPASGGVYLSNQALTADWSATDSLSGIASVTGTLPSGEIIDTSMIGQKTFTVVATDNAGNTITQTAHYTTAYNFLGILPPINVDGSSIFKSGSTVPVKFRITDANGNYVSSALANITYQFVNDETIGSVEKPVSTSAANEDNTFRYDSTENLYIFNLGTEGMNTGTYQLNINLDDGTTHTVRISLR